MKKEVKEQNVTQETEVKEEVKTEEPKLDLATHCCCHVDINKQPSLEEELEKKRLEIIHANEEIENLKKSLAHQEKLKKYDEMTRDIKDIYDSLVKQGFTDDQAFQILMLNMESVCSCNSTKSAINSVFGTHRY